jgi:LmbE family N-acetylglucosaminyl deacetylase
MKILCIHAHFDDFEFVAAGTFERWRCQLGVELKSRLIVCTDGRSGHHARTRVETACLRLAEQEASARLGQIEFELLRKPGGEPFVEACRSATNELLAALWKAIREFEPDYLFCPPLPADPQAGVHPDHITVAEAVRRVAYMINVPHAFLDEYPVADETQSRWIKTPVILNTYDGYMAGGNGGDLVVDVEPAFDLIAEMSWCHQSQIREWLPWIGRHNMPPVKSLTEWKGVLRQRFQRQQRELGLPLDRAAEVFTVTAWGTVPTLEQLERDFPGLVTIPSRTAQLRQKLQRWSG